MQEWEKKDETIFFSTYLPKNSMIKEKHHKKLNQSAGKKIFASNQKLLYGVKMIWNNY